MDVLSSQANIAGYKAVLIAANEYRRFMPLLMTAAGTVKAARVLVLGAGVAGLQAIATAKRLGAVVEAFDVRPAVKEQVESLGAKFIEVPVSDAERAPTETAGGYAREMSDEYQQRQAALIAERAARPTSSSPRRSCPAGPRRCWSLRKTVKSMKPGSVIVDLAVEQGGNCALTERDRVDRRARRPNRRLLEPARAARRRRQRPVRTKSPELRQSARQIRRQATLDDRPERRDHRGDAGLHRRRGRPASARRHSHD